MKKKILSILLAGIMMISLTGCGASNGAEKAVKKFVKCEYEADLQCIATSINYSGAIAYRKTSSTLDDYWDKYNELEEKNTNKIVMENAKENYELLKNLYNVYGYSIKNMQTEKLTKDLYKVKTTINLKDKDRNWDITTNYIVVKANGTYSVIDTTADDRPAIIINDAIKYMVKGLKYDDGTSISY